MNNQEMGLVVSVDNLCRDFGAGKTKTPALTNISFDLHNGEAVALLGVNGAGKTTLSKILATWLYPTSGTVTICGADVQRQSKQARANVVAVFGGDRGLYPMLTGAENLAYFTTLRGERAVSKRELAIILEEVGLGSAGSKRVETYSKGMKQRLHLAIGMVSTAPLLILDEPTVGLDPIEAARFRSTLSRITEQGRTLLLTSHNLADVRDATERILFIDEGAIKYDLPVSQFTSLAGFEYQLSATVDRRVSSNAYQVSDNGDGTFQVVRLLSDVDKTKIADYCRELQNYGLIDFTVRPASLEEAFSAAFSRGK